jgi:hypothetical protein
MQTKDGDRPTRSPSACQPECKAIGLQRNNLFTFRKLTASRTARYTAIEERTMKKMLAALVVAGTLLSPVVNAVPKEAAAMPKVGDMAPDFKLSFFDGNDLKQVTLDQYRGKKQVVLAFYIFAFTGG